MSYMETNAYLIENLNDLNCRYKTYQIRGLSQDVDEYHKNTQLLMGNLSRITKSPCYIYRADGRVYVVQPEGYPELPESFDVIGMRVKIDKLSDLKELRFDSLDLLTMPIAQRFLQFSLQNPLFNNPLLWQPRAGHPFYHKSPDQELGSLSSDVDLLKGFMFRVMVIKDELGICVDTSSKYVARHPLPTRITRETFRKLYQGENCLYEYGDRWYEIRVEGLSDLNAGDVELPDGNSLFNHLHENAGTQKSQNLLSLPKDCPVLIYRTALGETRHAPSGLCRMTYATDHPQVKDLHSKTIKPPWKRRAEIQFVVDRYLRHLKFGSKEIKLSTKPHSVKTPRINVPDLEFGRGKVLSVRGTLNAIQTSIEEYGSKKRDLLYSQEAGPYGLKPFDRQYLFLPRSVYETYGKAFVEDLKDEVHRLLHGQRGINYSPILVPYEDSVQMSVYNLGKAILRGAEDNRVTFGYAVVMIPRIQSKRFKEDELANLIMRKMREKDIYASVIHSSVPHESYRCQDDGDKQRKWRITDEVKQRGKFKGYLKNVVLNKIFLVNSCWPFVLKTPLNADLTIGIDVKNSIAGFTLIYRTGGELRFFTSESTEKERLSKAHIQSEIVKILSEDREMLLSKPVMHVVIHRQGRLFPSEQEGISEALKLIAKRGLIGQGYTCTFVEIQRTSRVPFRLFDIKVSPHNQKEDVRNPMIGVYYCPVTENETFLCNTGLPFQHKGTTKPLHIIKRSGEMPLEKIIEDIFFLANLTWTKVDDCSRDPLSIKMTDIRLRETAGKYDEDAYSFDTEGGGGGDE